MKCKIKQFFVESSENGQQILMKEKSEINTLVCMRRWRALVGSQAKISSVVEGTK